jgi:hypothetical protein
MGWRDILAAVGLGTPFIFAAGTYAFFNWLNRNASEKANRAISEWLKGDPYSKIDMKSAILSTFDHIYSYPLSTIVAFKSLTQNRVGCISILVRGRYA